MNQIQKIHLSLGRILVWIMVGIPALLWFRATAQTPRFENFSAIMMSLGQLLGLAGMSLFAVNLLLSARLRWVESLFFGLNRVYSAHSRYGQIAFIALLFHPLFLAIRYGAGSWRNAAQFLLPSRNWPIDFGIAALWLMILLIILTIYAHLKYHIWKWTHKFFGFAFFLASLHVLLIPGAPIHYAPLRWYILTLSALGLLAYLYRSVFGRFFVRRFHATVSDLRSFPNVTQITFAFAHKRMNFLPGQFVFIRFQDKTIGKEEHPFSIISSPEDETISIAVKNLGDYTSRLSALTIGTPVSIEGPFGRFSYLTTPSTQQLWIAGGIGITPFLSMARSLHLHPDYHVDLYYCVKNKNESVYIHALQEIERLCSGLFRVILFCSDSQGFVTAEHIAKMSSGLENKEFFLCAPPVMIHALTKQFLGRGVQARAIHSEEFSL